MQKAQAYIDKLEGTFGVLASHKGSAALVAFALAVVVFVPACLAWVPNGVYDDWSISNALSGNWGADEGLCLFLNAALSRLVFAMNVAFPSVNWFFALERLCAFASFWLACYVAFTRLDAAMGCVTALGCTLLFVPGCTYQSNFTYVAGIMVFAGGLALACSLASGGHDPALVACGVTFMAFGAAWRETMFLLCVPVMGFSALAIVLLACQRNRAHLSAQVGRLWPFFAVLACVFVLHAFDAHAWNEQPWSEWYEFNEARSDIADYSYESYDQMAEKLQALGVSQNDYRLLKSWITEDPDFFTVARMQGISAVSTGRRLDGGRMLLAIPGYFADAVSSARLDVIVALLALCVTVRMRGRTRVAALAVVVLTLAIAVGLFAFGRLPARVHLPLWMFAVASVGALSVFDARAGGSGDAEAGTHDVLGRASNVARRAVSAICAVVMAGSLAYVVGMGVTHACPDRLAPLVDEGAFAPQSSLVDYMRSHPDDVYVLNIAGNAELVYANLMVAPLDHETILQTTSLGGWAAHAPYAAARNELIGMANPIRGLVDNSRALLVCGGPDTADTLLTYIRQHYYPNASYREIDSVSVSSGSGTLRFYRFSR